MTTNSIQNKKQLIVIEGPTASGKTALGVALAKKWKTVVLSADSRQFYKELSIGTAKPSIEEQEGIKHYFIDSHSLSQELTSAKYAKEANEILKKEFGNHDKILLVGGSGMFIDALCVGLDEIPTSGSIKQELTKQWKTEGLEPLLNELQTKDPIFFEEVDKGNPMRVIRALEAIRITNVPFSTLRTATPKELFFDVRRFVIQHERESLYERINKRVDVMIENGLIEEVKSVFHLKESTPLKTVGYTELFSYLNGIITFEDAILLIKQNTRRYAKRQLTWFRKHADASWIDYTTTEEMADEIIRSLDES